MKFTSTRNNSKEVSFSQAILNCMPKDGGLYIPCETEDLRRWILNTDEDASFSNIAGTLTSAFINDEFSPIICETIATRAFPFSPEIKQLENNLFLLELNNTPTGNHRDFGISYLTACLETILQLQGKSATLVGVSERGDLCSSLTWCLRGKKHLKAVIISPKGKLRGIKEDDYVWNGGNVYPVEVNGDEQKCHALVREIFSDASYVKKHNLTVANTTNIGRLLPQAFFYPYAFSRIKNKVHSDIYYALAAGNYSNVVAGLYAWQFALPLNGFIVPATDAFTVNPGGTPIILDSLVPMNERESADPTEPSNLERLEKVFSANKLMMRHFVFPVEINDDDVNEAAKELFTKYGVIADRHTARAFASAKIQKENSEDEYATVLIARDHPSLSPDYIRQTIGETPEMPGSVYEALKASSPGKPAVSTVEEIKKIIESL